MKVTIDRNGCVSCGTCWETCPKFFEQNAEDSFSQVIPQFQTDEKPAEGSAPPEMEACVSEAADFCPVQVIHRGE
jgi:ferredoxin